jgi:hypothetical protein
LKRVVDGHVCLNERLVHYLQESVVRQLQNVPWALAGPSVEAIFEAGRMVLSLAKIQARSSGKGKLACRDEEDWRSGMKQGKYSGLRSGFALLFLKVKLDQAKEC